MVDFREKMHQKSSKFIILQMRRTKSETLKINWNFESGNWVLVLSAGINRWTDEMCACVDFIIPTFCTLWDVMRSQKTGLNADGGSQTHYCTRIWGLYNWRIIHGDYSKVQLDLKLICQIPKLLKIRNLFLFSDGRLFRRPCLDLPHEIP